MLIEFSVKNYRSIKEQQKISLVSASGAELESTNTSPILNGKLSLVRSAAIYGPNASGKSNLIKALQAMERVVLLSANLGQRGVELPIEPYMFDRESQELPSEFEVIFLSDGVRYQYGFAATKKQVFEEWLIAYPKGYPQVWIDRKYDTHTNTYVWGKMDKLKGTKHIWQENTRSNALFLSKAIQDNNKQLQPVFDWFESTLRIFGLGQLAPTFTFDQFETEQGRQRILDFMKVADFTISDVNVKKESRELQQLLDELPVTMRAKISQEMISADDVKIDQYDVKTVHIGENGDRYVLDFEEESDGTKKFLSFAGPWLDVLQHGYVLFVDELNDNLHPHLVKFLVQLFHDNRTNQKNAQLIFTAHETSILTQEVFRRDQVWFTEKDEFNATTLYPLSDFSPRKGVEHLEKSYLQGRYGALPYFGDVASLFDRVNA